MNLLNFGNIREQNNNPNKNNEISDKRKSKNSNTKIYIKGKLKRNKRISNFLIKE